MADTNIGSAYNTSHAEKGMLNGAYWISDQIGAVVYQENFGTIDVARTTDGGSNWTSYEIYTSGAPDALSVWFDQETPGDTGTLLHIITLDNNKTGVQYSQFDISDATSSTAEIANFSNLSIEASGITKTVSGNLIVSYRSATGAFYQSGCLKSTDGGSNWSSISNPFEGDTHNDYLKLFPAETADNNDACAIFFDASASEISVKMYDDSANTWTETSITTGITIDTSYWDADAAVRHSDGHILLATHVNSDTTTDDILTFDITVDSISSPTVTSKTDVITNTAESGFAAVVIDQNTDDVYIGYIRGTTLYDVSHVYYKKSTDGMSTWGSETQYTDTQDDYRTLSGGRSIGTGGGLVQFSVFNDDTNVISVNLVNDVLIEGTVKTASVTAISVALSIQSVTATYNAVISAGVAAISATASLPSVTATYGQAETASLAEIGATLSVQSVTATYDANISASVAQIDTTLSVQAATATYDAVISAGVTVVGGSLSIPAVTATHLATETFFIDQIKFTFTAPANVADVSPVDLTASIPATTATYAAIITAGIAVVDATLTIQAVTATYDSIQSASVAVIDTTLSVQAITATYVQVETAALAVVDATLNQPATTATYDGNLAAGVATVDNTLSVQTTTATYDAVISASIATVDTTLSILGTTATYDANLSAGVATIDSTLSIPSVTATSSSTFNADVVAVTLTGDVPSTTASYDAVLSAQLIEVLATAFVPDVTAAYDFNNVASVAEVGLSATLPAVMPYYSTYPESALNDLYYDDQGNVYYIISHTDTLLYPL